MNTDKASAPVDWTKPIEAVRKSDGKRALVMTDIVDRLRNCGDQSEIEMHDAKKAADEIERLRRLIDGAYHALCDGSPNAISQARAALKGDDMMEARK